MFKVLKGKQGGLPEPPLPVMMFLPLLVQLSPDYSGSLLKPLTKAEDVNLNMCRILPKGSSSTISQ